MFAIECRHLAIVNTANIRGWRNRDYPRARGPGKGYDYVVQIPQKWVPCLGLVVCSGRADLPRFIVMPLTLMTPRLSPPGIVSEYPSPQMRMAGAHPWRLESIGASRMGSGQSTCLRATRAPSRQQLPDWYKRERYRGSSSSSKPVPSRPACSACSQPLASI